MEVEFTDEQQIIVRQRARSDQNRNGSVVVTEEERRASSEYTPKAVAAVVILTVINLLNYADRLSVPGKFIARAVNPDIHFDHHCQGGLLHLKVKLKATLFMIYFVYFVSLNV